MREKLEQIRVSAIEALNACAQTKEIDELKVKFLGKKGELTAILKEMKNLSAEERPVVGQLANEVRQQIETAIEETKKNLAAKEQEAKLASETIDVTMPGKKAVSGHQHPMNKVIDEICDIFIGMGYEIAEGPEVEKDLYNFELLNLPKGHPARDAQDTFYVKDEEYLLRSQTSPVQARVMLEKEGKEPIRIICPGKTYRRDEDDATHSHQFTQMEGLLVDKDITLGDLKGTFEEIAKMLFGKSRDTRFRPSFYPFTEPSVEMDISCFNCNSKGCNICKGTGWITVGGAGMVNPIVLRNCGYNPDKWNGFAFGFGIERLAMLKYGINDIRTFYVNHDVRTLKQFDRREN